MDSRCTPTARWVRQSIRPAPTIPTAACGWPTRPRTSRPSACCGATRTGSVGLVDKRVGTLYNDNGTLNYLINGITIPYPVDQAITINPFNLVNVFVNYTIKNTSWLRGSKIGLAVNNLANSHNLVGITPGDRRDGDRALRAESERSAESAARTQRHGDVHRGLGASAMMP